MARDLRTPKYGRNAKETFSLAVNLSTFSTYLSFFSFPRWFDTNNNWDLHCMRSATDQSARGLFQLHAVIKSPKAILFHKMRNADLDKFSLSYKARFPGALQAQNSPCHRTQGLGWYSSSHVTSHRHHMIWNTESKRTKDHNFHLLV